MCLFWCTVVHQLVPHCTPFSTTCQTFYFRTSSIHTTTNITHSSVLDETEPSFSATRIFIESAAKQYFAEMSLQALFPNGKSKMASPWKKKVTGDTELKIHLPILCYAFIYRSTLCPSIILYSFMFADIGLADMTLEGGVLETGHVVERIGVGLIHWPNIVF